MRLHAFNAKKEYQKLMFKRNKGKYIKYGTIILSVCLLVFAIMYFSFSKFSTTKKFNVINAKVGDFSSGDYTIAAYIDGTKSSTIPLKTDGYGVEKIECTNNATAKWDYNAWTVNISATTPTKCNIYFNASTLSNRILNIAGGTTVIAAKTTPNFANISTTDEGMFATTDDYGTSYYYRGAVTTNNVIFGGFCWKVIRINGDGTTRMIYNGTPTSNQCTTTTGTGTQISTSAYNTSYNNNMYVGYMYTSGEVHGTGTSSTAKTAIDTWYNTNLSSYSSKISDTLFCNDRSPSTSSSSLNGSGGTGTTTTYYGAYIRNITKKTPILTCENQSDRFTVSDSSKGNAKLTYPIGLITADEITMAGGVYNVNNTSYYLYTNQAYWSMSAGRYSTYLNNAADRARPFDVRNTGLEYIQFSNSVFGMRPVINLKTDTLYTSGSGTSTSPY